MYCENYNCPYYNFENGPFYPSEDDKKMTMELFNCDENRVRICTSTTPDGIVHDEEALMREMEYEKEIMK